MLFEIGYPVLSRKKTAVAVMSIAPCWADRRADLKLLVNLRIKIKTQNITSAKCVVQSRSSIHVVLFWAGRGGGGGAARSLPRRAAPPCLLAACNTAMHWLILQVKVARCNRVKCAWCTISKNLIPDSRIDGIANSAPYRIYRHGWILIAPYMSLAV